MTQTPGVTEDSAKFFRIISLVVDVGSDCLRDLLTTFIPIPNLANELQSNIMILNRLHKAGVLHQDQYGMLTGPNPNPEEFDISLLVVLLRNICPNVDPPVGGWIIKTPDVNDFSLGAELIRLRNIRNTVYAHRTSTRLTDNDFQSIWKELTECILRISKHGSPNKELEVQKSIEEMKHRALDPTGGAELRSLNQFQKWHNELDETIQTAKQEIIEHIDKQHEKLEESYERLKQVQDQMTFTNLQMLGLQNGLMNKTISSQHDAIDSKKDRTTESHRDMRSSEAEQDAPDIQEQDSAALQRQCVILIKLYPWLKDEMDKTSAVVIASKVLSRDHTESIFNSSQRRMAVDMLLKIVLKNKYSFLSKFFGVLKDTWNSKDMLEQKLEAVNPTENEVEGTFIRLNDNLKLSSGPTRSQCVIEGRDKEILVFQVKDIVTIDTLNNHFLSRLLFSLQDHDSVCDYLHISDLSGGARCLINNMEKCSASVMQTFCEIMTSLRMGYVIQALDFQRRYCQIRTGSFPKTVVSSDEHYLYFNAVKTFRKVKGLLKEMIGFMVTGIDYGSVVYHLSPTTDRSWKQLEEKCVSGHLLNIFEEIFVDEDINDFLVAGEYRLQFTIYSVQSQSHQSKVQRTACLKLDLLLGNLNHTNVRVDASADPFQRNIDILCDELELSDELIELLMRSNMVTDDVAMKLQRIGSRAARIKFLLTQIPHSEKGYQTIKDYIKQSNSYLYQEIDKKDNEPLRRELVYQCETKLKSSVSDFEMRFKFHSENEFPFPEPLSQAMKTYPSRRARNNAASSRNTSQHGRTWVTVAC